MRVLKLGHTRIGNTKFDIAHRGGFVRVTVRTGLAKDDDFWMFRIQVSTENAKKRGIIGHLQNQIDNPNYDRTKSDRIRLRALLLQHEEHVTRI